MKETAAAGFSPRIPLKMLGQFKESEPSFATDFTELHGLTQPFVR